MFKKIQNIKLMLSDEICCEVINKYFDKIIRKGVYFPLEIAKKIIYDKGFRLEKEERLINTLNLISQCRGINKANQTLHGNNLNDFNRSLRELADLNINPVTIPKEWNIKYIPNLLNAYYDKISCHNNSFDPFKTYFL